MIHDLNLAALILAAIAFAGVAAAAITSYAHRRCTYWVETGVRYPLPTDNGDDLVPPGWAYIDTRDEQ